MHCFNPRLKLKTAKFSEKFFLYLFHCVGLMYTDSTSGGSRNFEKGGRQYISPVVIHHKCTQRTICLLCREKRLIGKKSGPIGNRERRLPQPPCTVPLNPPLYLAYWSDGVVDI